MNRPGHSRFPQQLRLRRPLSLALLGTGAMLLLVGGAGAIVVASPPVNSTLPVISGVARAGETLSASSGSWGGTTPISYSYQWQRCDSVGADCHSVSRANGQTLRLGSSDVGHTLRVLVVAVNSAGSAQAISTATGVVASGGSSPAATRQPDPHGTAKEGSTISVDNGSWAGSQPISFRYQWQRCTVASGVCSDISGARSNSYTVVSADIGHRLRAAVIASNQYGQTSIYSNLTETVVPRDVAPSIVSLPVISGNASVGQTLAVSTGVWRGASNRFDYQWLRCNPSGSSCLDLAAAKAATYKVTSDDAGQTLRVRVRASNNIGSAEATSNAVLVTPSGVIEIGGGLKSVPVSSLVPRPDRLLISQVRFSPSPVRTRGGIIIARFRVQAEGSNHVVRGALVKLVGIPYNWIVQPPELPTGTDGWVAFQIRTTDKMQLRHGGALVIQVRARAPGASPAAILGGISTRRLVQLPLETPR